MSSFSQIESGLQAIAKDLGEVIKKDETIVTNEAQAAVTKVEKKAKEIYKEVRTEAQVAEDFAVASRGAFVRFFVRIFRFFFRK